MSDFSVPVLVKRVREGVTLPVYATSGSVGIDLETADSAEIPPFGTVAIPTGIAVSIPEGFEIQIRPRSGLSLQTGLRVANSPGTIDSDYRGEIKVIIQNTSHLAFSINKGQKIAQGVLCPVFKIQWQEASSLEETTRGEGGFGSTDKKT